MFWNKVKNMAPPIEPVKDNKQYMMTIRLNKEDHLIIEGLSNQMDLSKSHIIRSILHDFMEGHGLSVEDYTIEDDTEEPNNEAG